MGRIGEVKREFREQVMIAAAATTSLQTLSFWVKTVIVKSQKLLLFQAILCPLDSHDLNSVNHGEQSLWSPLQAILVGNDENVVGLFFRFGPLFYYLVFNTRRFFLDH